MMFHDSSEKSKMMLEIFNQAREFYVKERAQAEFFTAFASLNVEDHPELGWKGISD